MGKCGQSVLQERILKRCAERFGTSATLAALRGLPPDRKRDIKVWLGSLIIDEGLTDDGELSANGLAIDDLIDQIGY